jgi:catechol 2,3-dioxygenase-like lactoylglutathione lyase family enzyme
MMTTSLSREPAGQPGDPAALAQPDAPALAGVHHLKLPVTDLARSREWYRSRLGYQVRIEFVEHGRLMGYVLAHPNGGPVLGLRLSPERARAAAGFDYFAIGVPDQDAIVQLAAHLSALGEQHTGVHWATIGWILPGLHDPDGHEVRFYTLQEHTDLPPGAVTTINDPRESAQRRAEAMAGQDAAELDGVEGQSAGAGVVANIPLS